MSNSYWNRNARGIKFVLHGDYDEDENDDDDDMRITKYQHMLKRSTTLHLTLHARASGHAYRKGSSV